jgi:transposase
MNGLLVEGMPGQGEGGVLELLQDLRREVVALRQQVADLHHQNAELRRENAELRRENAELRRQNLELRQEAGYWKSRHADAVARMSKLAAEVEQLRGENRQLRARLFGQTSERSAAPDRSNHLPGEEDENALPPGPRGQRKGRPGPQRRDYHHLPVVEEYRELPSDERVCSQCGAPLTPSGTEDAEQLEIDVRAYRRRIRRRRYQRTCDCQSDSRTLVAPPPPKLIPKGLLGVSLWVEVLLGKFFGHHPLERQLSQWRLLGLDLSPGTVTGGLERLEPLFTPVYEALLARHAQAGFAQADETRWLVFIEHEGKVAHRWWLWVFLSADTVVFRLDPRRSHDVPEGHFAADACVVLMVDRYSAYKAMAQVKLGNTILVFCWAHVRRDFVEVGKGWDELKPWALAWLQRIRELYHQQRQRLAHAAGSAEFAAADAAVRQTVADLHRQATAELADPQLREPCRKTLTSLQEHWPGLTRFVDDLRIPLDNNASERANRGPAVGRKNYYGSGSLWSGRLAAMLFSLFATLTRHGLNPRLWLSWYLQNCAEAGGHALTDIAPFLPWNLTSERRQSLALEPHDSS